MFGSDSSMEISFERHCGPLPPVCIEPYVMINSHTPTRFIIYTISVFSLHNVTFCKERVYSPCSLLIRESLDIG